MPTRIQVKRGTTDPTGLTTGEFGYNTTNSTLFIGNTAAQRWIGGEITGGVDMGAGSAASQNRVPTQNSVYQYARNNFVHRLNGITGGITLNAGANITITSSVGGGITIASSDTVGVTAGDAVTWTQLQRFPAGISAHGATLSGTVTAPTQAIGTNNTTVATTAFVQNEIIADTVTSVNGATGAITNVARTNAGNTFSVVQVFNAGISAAGGITLNGSLTGVTATFNGLVHAASGVSAPTGNFRQISIPRQAVSSAASRISIGTYGSISETASGAAYIQGNAVAASTASGTNEIIKTSSNSDKGNFIRMRYDQGVSIHTGISGTVGTTFADNENQRFRIDNDGNTTIGTGNNTGYTLDVKGTINATGLIRTVGGISADGALTFNGTITGATATFSRLVTGNAGFSGALTGTATNASALGGTAAASWALLASPTFTGTPAAPTPAIGTNTTQIATTAFVQSEIVADTVTSFNGRTGSVQGVSAAVAGDGISVSGATGAVTITNSGVTRAVAGTGIGLNANTGTVTITNNGVQSFNGLTGAVGGVCAAQANTFTALQTFTTGVSADGALTLNGTITGATATFNRLVTGNAGFSGALTGTATNASALGGVAAASYAQLASPAFTGTPTSTTAAIGTNTTQIATTAFVQSEIVADTVTSIDGVTGAITNVARTNAGNTFSVVQVFNAGISAAGGVTANTLSVTGTSRFQGTASFNSLGVGISAGTAVISSVRTDEIVTALNNPRLRVRTFLVPGTASLSLSATDVSNVDDHLFTITPEAATASRGFTLPNESGTFALRGENTFTGLQTLTAGLSAAGGITLNGSLTGTTATFSGNQTVGGSLTVTNGITFGSGTTFMAFIPKESANPASSGGGLWIRSGDLQVGGSAFGNTSTFNIRPLTETHNLGGNFTINTAESYQAAQNTLTLNTGSSHTGRPLRISRGANNFIAGCEPDGTWFGTGLSASQITGTTATFSGTVESNAGFRIGAGAINAQTAGYTLAAGDNGKVITMNSSSALTLTAGTAVGATGFSCTVIQLGTGQVTIAGSGVTLNSFNGLKIAGQHGAASIVCYQTNVFNVAGNLTT